MVDAVLSLGGDIVHIEVVARLEVDVVGDFGDDIELGKLVNRDGIVTIADSEHNWKLGRVGGFID